MNRMIGLRRGLDFVDHRLQPVLEFALDAGAGLQQAEVERAEGDVLQGRRHVAGGDAQREAFDDGGLAHARFAGEDRVVLAAAGEDIDDLADFAVAAQDGIDLAAAGPGGEVDGELVERRRFRGAGRRAGTASPRSSDGRRGGGFQLRLRRCSATTSRQFLVQRLGRNFLEFRRGVLGDDAKECRSTRGRNSR